MKLNKIPLIIYSFALIFTLVLLLVINISGNYLDDNSSLLYQSIVLGIVLTGAVFGLVINIRINDKRKSNFHIIFVGGLIFSILSNLTKYLNFLGSVLYWIQVVTAIVGYLLIILFIVLLFVPNKSNNSK